MADTPPPAATTPTPAPTTTPAVPTAEKPAETIVETVEKAALSTATEVASNILKTTTPDLKSIENSLAKETLINDNDKDGDGIADETFLEKVEGAAQIVADEVVKGAQGVVKAVEERPELLAEGALAVAVGAASLIQPELLAGEVAIIGKMAGDSAKATLTKIAQEEGTKVVQAISKDAAESAKVVEHSAAKVQDSAQKVQESVANVEDSAKKVEQSANRIETAAEDVKKDEKGVSQDGLSKADATALGSAIAKNVSRGTKEDQVVTLELNQDGEGVQPPITLKITVGAEGEVKGVAHTVVDLEEVKKDESSEVKSKSEIENPKSEEAKVESVPKMVEKSKIVEPTAIEAKASTRAGSKAIEAPQIASNDKPVSLNVTIDGKGDVNSIKETPVEAKPGPIEIPKPEVLESHDNKIEETNPEEVSGSSSKVDDTKKDIPQTATLSHAYPHFEDAKSVAPSKEANIEETKAQGSNIEGVKIEDSQKALPETKKDALSQPPPATTENTSSEQHVPETVIDTPSKPETSSLPESKVVPSEPAPINNETETLKSQESMPVLKEISEVAAASLVGAAAVQNIEKLKSKDDASPEHVEDISPFVETEKPVGLEQSVPVISEKKNLEQEGFRAKEEASVKAKNEFTSANEPVIPAVVETRPSTEGNNISSTTQTEKFPEQEPTKGPLPIKHSATETKQKSPAPIEPATSSVEENVPSTRKDKDSEPEPVTAIKPIEKSPIGVRKESPPDVESKTPVFEEEKAPVTGIVKKLASEQEPESTKKPASVEPAKDIAAPVEVKKPDVEDESVPLIEQEKKVALASESTPSQKSAQPEEVNSTINELAPHIGTASEEETPIPVVEKSIDETKPQDEPVAKEAIDNSEAAIHENAKTESPVVDEDAEPKKLADKTAVEKPGSTSIPESSSKEEVPKEKVPETLVESIKPEPAHVDDSASTAKEPVTSRQPEQVSSKPSEKPLEEPKQKEVPLPITVEHVSQPATPSIPNTEPESKPVESKPESSSSETKAAETLNPAILAAAVAKAVAPITERPSSPTMEDIANIHTKLDNINEQLQLLTKTLSQQSAHRAAESISKGIEPVLPKEVMPKMAKAPEPVVPTPSKPEVPERVEEPATHEARPITVTIKSVENVKPSTSAAESKLDDSKALEVPKASESAPAPTPESKPDDKKTAETPKASDTSSSTNNTPSGSSQSAIETSSTPNSTTKPMHVKRRSVWGYLWPFGGSSQSAEPGRDKGTETPKTDEAPKLRESPEVVPESAHLGAA